MAKLKNFKQQLLLTIISVSIIASATSTFITLYLENSNNNAVILATMLSSIFSCLLALYSYPIFINPINYLSTYIKNLNSDDNNKINQDCLKYTELNNIAQNVNRIYISAENNRQSLAKSYQDAINDKSKLISSINHEFRTPLNAIINFSEIQMKEIMGPMGNQKYLEYAHDINRSGKELLNLVSDLLNISKSDNNLFSYKLDKIDSNNLIYEIIDIATKEFCYNNINLNTKILSQLPIIYGDYDKIKYLLLTTLSLSLSLTPEYGNVTLSVTDDKDFINFIIDNDGVELDEDEISNILDNYGLVTGDMDRKYPSVKTDLVLAHKLLHTIGGSIDIVNKEDIGSLVAIKLPKNCTEKNEQIHKTAKVVV